jgi:hypothetical protein
MVMLCVAELVSRSSALRHCSTSVYSGHMHPYLSDLSSALNCVQWYITSLAPGRT